MITIIIMLCSIGILAMLVHNWFGSRVAKWQRCQLGESRTQKGGSKMPLNPEPKIARPAPPNENLKDCH